MSLSPSNPAPEMPAELAMLDTMLRAEFKSRGLVKSVEAWESFLKVASQEMAAQEAAAKGA